MERKLAAIRAADVVGYTRLMAKDGAGTLAALKAHREEFIDPKTADHKGRLIEPMDDRTAGYLALASGAALSGKGVQLIPGGERLVAGTSGGGYGDPRQRDPTEVLRDLRQGLVSRAAAERDHAVVIDAEMNLDDVATARLRARDE